MSFIDDGSVANDKLDLRPRPSTADTRQWLKASEWNEAMNKLLDLRTGLINATSFGLEPQDTRPTPPADGAETFMWLRESDMHLIFFNGTDDVDMGAGGVGLSSASPVAVGTAAAGSSISASRSDHVHAHGDQMGGSLHAAASAGVSAGFMSSADKTKLDGIAAGATALALSSSTPAAVATSGSAGAGTTAAKADHVHAHGNQAAGGSLHAVATTSVAGFMPAADKAFIASLNSNIKIANDYAGADIGAKIMAADADLGASPGIIMVLSGNYTMSTQVRLSADRELRFGFGTITLADTGYGSFIFNNRNRYVGMGMGNTILVEKAASGALAKAFFRDKNAWNGADLSPNSAADGATDVYFADFQMTKGACIDFNDAVAALNIGNSHNVVVERVYVNETSSIGITAGGSALSGYVGSHIRVSDCKFRALTSQNLAAVNAKNFNFDDNLFLDAGQTGGPGSTYIDLEVNESGDSLENFSICRNKIDSRNSIAALNGIQVNGVSATAIGPGVITDNEIIGGDMYPVTPVKKMSNGIVVTYARDVLVSNNVVRMFTQNGITVAVCEGCTIHNNAIRNAGGGGNSAMYVLDSTNCSFSLNKIDAPDLLNGSCSTDITEGGSSDYNIYAENKIGDFNSLPGSITMLGANSREVDNTFNGIKAKVFVADGTIINNTLVKPGTTAGSVAQFTTSNTKADLVGVCIGTRTDVTKAFVVVDPSVIVPIKSDGTGTIAIGAAVQLSSSQHGRIKSGSTDQIGHNLGAATAATLDALTKVSVHEVSTGGAGSVTAGTGINVSGSTVSVKQSLDQNLLPTDITYTIGDSTHRLNELWTKAIYSGASANLLIQANTGQNINFAPAGATYFYMAAATFAPQNDVQSKLGTSGTRFTEIWVRVHAGVHQNVTSGGAVAVDTQLGEMAVLTSNANVSGITLAAGKAAQVFTLEMVQGNATHTWPSTITNARLAGGLFTKTATLNAVDTITFRYNSTTSTWDEIARTLALS